MASIRPYKRSRGNLLGFLLFLLILLLGVGTAAYWKMNRPAPSQKASTIMRGSGSALPTEKIPLSEARSLESMDREVTELVDHVVPSVVSITTTPAPDREALVRLFFGLSRGGIPKNNKMGSGMIVSPEGHIVTNWHVINGASQVTIQLNDGRTLPAVVAGADQRSDIAVLKVEAEGLSPIAFSDSELVKVGQMVFAVGNPFGLQETVTQGIISAKGRRTMSEAANEFFQTSTTINPGNSGGPLVDIHGKVIGINNFILSRSGGSEGISFAIPSNVARRVYEDIVERGRVLLTSAADTARERFQKIRATFPTAPGDLELAGALSVRQSGCDVEVLVDGNGASMMDRLRARRPVDLRSQALTLEEIFVAAGTLGRAAA